MTIEEARNLKIGNVFKMKNQYILVISNNKSDDAEFVIFKVLWRGKKEDFYIADFTAHRYEKVC